MRSAEWYPKIHDRVQQTVEAEIAPRGLFYPRPEGRGAHVRALSKQCIHWNN